jgi:hypothetical protein
MRRDMSIVQANCLQRRDDLRQGTSVQTRVPLKAVIRASSDRIPICQIKVKFSEETSL